MHKLQEDLGAMSMGYGQGQIEMWGHRQTGCGRGGARSLRQEDEQKWSTAGKGARERTQGWEWMVAEPRLERRTGMMPGPAAGLAPLAVSACPGTGLSGSTSLSSRLPLASQESPLI